MIAVRGRRALGGSSTARRAERRASGALGFRRRRAGGDRDLTAAAAALGPPRPKRLPCQVFAAPTAPDARLSFCIDFAKLAFWPTLVPYSGLVRASAAAVPRITRVKACRSFLVKGAAWHGWQEWEQLPRCCTSRRPSRPCRGNGHRCARPRSSPRRRSRTRSTPGRTNLLRV